MAGDRLGDESAKTAEYEVIANRILLALPQAVLQRTMPHLEPVNLQAGHLCRAPKDLLLTLSI